MRTTRKVRVATHSLPDSDILDLFRQKTSQREECPLEQLMCSIRIVTLVIAISLLFLANWFELLVQFVLFMSHKTPLLGNCCSDFCPELRSLHFFFFINFWVCWAAETGNEANCRVQCGKITIEIWDGKKS